MVVTGRVLTIVVHEPVMVSVTHDEEAVVDIPHPPRLSRKIAGRLGMDDRSKIETHCRH